MAPFTEIEKTARDSGLYPLRPAQAKALQRIAAGENLLIVWPTGFGKSACYQLPAVASEGLTLVISPLIALMDDQVNKARALGWPATCIHSGVERRSREQRLVDTKAGKYRLVYVTPERFRQPGFVEGLPPVHLLAVDEAHCISQWGHDFRPDYSRLGEIRAMLGNPQTLALTATATLDVQADILKQLNLTSATPILWEGVERPNLHLSAREYESEDEKVAGLIEWLKEVPGCKIVYCTLIGTLGRLSAELRRAGFSHDTYHGDLPDNERRRSLSRFIDGSSQLMLATPAFGLGIDKPDIRSVVHFEVSNSIEAYFQEVGRAGRDGQNSHCLFQYVQDDLTIQMRFLDTLTPEPSFVQATYRLLENWKDRLNVVSLDDMREQLSFKNKRDFRLETALSFLDRWGVIRFQNRRLDKLEFLRPLNDADLDVQVWQARRQQLQKKLLSVVQWFRSEECRKVQIYHYFGWSNETPCGFCDRCDEANPNKGGQK